MDGRCSLMSVSSPPVEVPLGLLRRYLTLRNWHPEPGAPGPARSLRSERLPLRWCGDHPAQDEGFQLEAARWVSMSLRSLSQLEDREPQKVAADIRWVGADVLQSRLPDHLVRDDAIHLDVAMGFIRHMRGLLAGAATTELKPERLFGRVAKEGQTYAARCRFGHTFRGSFGFTIESPVGRNETPAFPGIDHAPPPFERRVVERLARGFSALELAASSEDPSLLADSYRTGFSANMCEDFVSMMEATRAEAVAFSFRLSPEWHSPTDVTEHLRLSARPEHVEVAREAAEQLRKQEFDRETCPRGTGHAPEVRARSVGLGASAGLPGSHPDVGERGPWHPERQDRPSTRGLPASG